MIKAEKNKQRWTIEEDVTLEVYWGNLKVSTIAERLGRSVRSVEHRAITLGLGGMYEGSGHLSVSDIVEMLGVNKTTVCKWIREGSLKAKKVILKKQGSYVIIKENYIDWLKNNTSRWHSSKIEYGCLGLELEKEEWLIEKRKKDNLTKRKREPYTPSEDKKILELYLKGHSMKEIAIMVNRTYEGVRHRVIKMRNENSKIPFKNAKTQTLRNAM